MTTTRHDARQALLVRTLAAVAAPVPAAEQGLVAGLPAGLGHDAVELGCPMLASAVALARLAARVDGGDPDLMRHALDVVALVCQNELQQTRGTTHADLGDVLSALDERVGYHSGRVPTLS